MTLNPVVPLNARTPQWTFAERLRKARREVGLNQETMADRLGVKTSTYGAWETGRNRPDLTDLAPKLEAATGISRMWFIGWAESSMEGPGGPGGGANSRASGYKDGSSSSPRGTLIPLFNRAQSGDEAQAA